LHNYLGRFGLILQPQKPVLKAYGSPLRLQTATVASTVYAFLDKHPNAYIVASGSTNVRTRLYRMGITNNLAEIKEDFVVYGLSEKGTWVEFEIGEDYEAFFITKK
jgi:hypothetical protein